MAVGPESTSPMLRAYVSARILRIARLVSGCGAPSAPCGYLCVCVRERERERARERERMCVCETQARQHISRHLSLRTPPTLPHPTYLFEPGERNTVRRPAGGELRLGSKLQLRMQLRGLKSLGRSVPQVTNQLLQPQHLARLTTRWLEPVRLHHPS